jgi:hypothetical protein
MASPAEHPLHPAPKAVDRAVDRAIDGHGIPDAVTRLLHSAELKRRDAILATGRDDHRNAALHHRAAARDYAEALAVLEGGATRPATG